MEDNVAVEMPVAVPVFDSLVVAAVAAEIRARAGGARISDVLQPDGYTIALQLRGTAGVVLCSIHPRWARCLLVPRAEGRPSHPFALQLRARLAGAVVRDAAAEPFERILTLTCAALEGDVALILEVMGRHSNLLLVDGGRVAGAFKTVTRSMSRVRPILPGHPYSPPPRDRPTPAEVDEHALAAHLSAGRPVADTLVRTLLGISPPVAVHVAEKAGLDPVRPAAPDAAGRLVAVLRDLAAVVVREDFAPVRYEDATGRAVAYAAIPLLIYRDLVARPAASMSAAVAAVIETGAEAAALDDLRRRLLARIEQAAGRAERGIADIEAQIAAGAEAGTWRRFGELLLAYAPTVARGAAAATVPDFDGTPVTIPLDPHRTPVANAQAYFRRHRKATAARRILPQRLAVLQADRAYLEEARILVVQAEGHADLRALAEELAGTGVARGRRAGRRPAPSPAPRAFLLPGGARVLVGRTGPENDHLTFKVAGPDDLWLHARGMPGAHVVLMTDGRTPRPDDVAAAASVAAYYSRGRGATGVSVDVTARRHVRKPRGAKPGMVTYQQARTVLAEPRLPAATAATPQAAPQSRRVRKGRG